MANLPAKTIRQLGQVLRPESEKKTKNTGLGPANPRPGIPAVNALAREQQNRRDAGPGGVASPLTEGTLASPSTVQRMYYTVETIVSTDGILAFEVEQVKQITLVDDQFHEIVFNFSQET